MRITVHVHHHFDDDVIKEIRMAKQDVLDAIAGAKATFTAKLAEAQSRIQADFDELKRLLAEGANTADIEAAVADLGTTITDSLAAVDPDPNFPAPPPVEPPL